MIQSILVYTFIIMVMSFLAISARNESIRYDNFSSITNQKTKFWYPEVIFMILFFSLMFGMRFNVGTDHLTYLLGYISGESAENLRFEPLFRYITAVCYNWEIHPIIYFAILAFIQITFFLLAFKNELYLFPLLIFSLFFNGEFMFWMNGTRQALAMCIWLYSINYIYKKKLWHYLLCGIIASLFHKSAIVLVVFYPIFRNGKDYFRSILLQIILLILAIIIRYSFKEFIIQFESIITQFQNLLSYESYSIENMIGELDRKVGGSGLAFLFKTMVWIVIILYSKRLKSFYNNKKFNITYSIFFMGILADYAIPPGAIVLYRPFRYLMIFKTVMLAYFIYYLFKEKSIKYNKLLGLFLILSFIGIFYLNQMTQPIDNTSWFKFYSKDIVDETFYYYTGVQYGVVH